MLFIYNQMEEVKLSHTVEGDKVALKLVAKGFEATVGFTKDPQLKELFAQKDGFVVTTKMKKVSIYIKGKKVLFVPQTKEFIVVDKQEKVKSTVQNIVAFVTDQMVTADTDTENFFTQQDVECNSDISVVVTCVYPKYAKWWLNKKPASVSLLAGDKTVAEFVLASFKDIKTGFYSNSLKFKDSQVVEVEKDKVAVTTTTSDDSVKSYTGQKKAYGKSKWEDEEDYKNKGKKPFNKYDKKNGKKPFQDAPSSMMMEKPASRGGKKRR